MNRRVSVLVTGSEVLGGLVQDTNSRFIAETLALSGVSLRHVLICDDDESSILEAMSFLLSKSDVLIISGGLGPTMDDLTRDAVARYAGVRLVQNDAVLDALKRRYEERKRTFDPSNARQALFPEGAVIIANPTGTAAGFVVTLKRHKAQAKTIMALPGVPSELRPMFTESVLPMIRWELGGAEETKERVLRCFGLPESDIGSRISAKVGHPEVAIAYRIFFPEIHVHFRSSSEAALAEAHEKARAAIGSEYVFSDDPRSGLEEKLAEIAKGRGLSVAVGETVAGGLLAAHVFQSGMGDSFKGGVLVPSDLSAPLPSAAVPFEPEKLRSASGARDLALQVRSHFGSDMGLSITGGEEEGSFFVGVSIGEHTRAYRGSFLSRAYEIRRYAAYKALDLARREILGLSLPDPAE